MEKAENDDKFEKELIDFMVLHGIEGNKKTGKWNKSFINRLKTVKSIRPDGSTYYTQVHDGWKLGTIKYTKCQYCLEDLQDKQRVYCSANCRDLGNKIRKKLEKMKNGAYRVSITKDPRGKPTWKENFTVHYRNGTKKPLSTKRGKPKP